MSFRRSLLLRVILGLALSATSVVSRAATAAAVVPQSAPAGARFVVVGFGLDAGTLAVTFRDVSGANVPATLLSRTSGLAEGVVPPSAVTGPVQVIQNGTTLASFTFTLAVTPTFAKVITLAGKPSGGGDDEGDGDNGKAVLRQPAGLAATPAGDLFVADASLHEIRRVTSAGVVSIFSGSGKRGYKEGATTAAQFNAPQGVAYDAARNVLYVADTGNHVIRKIAADGTTSLFAGTAPSNKSENDDDHGTKSTFDAPAGLALDASGNLYVADSGLSQIFVVTPAGTVTLLAGGKGEDGGRKDGPAAQARFKAPRALVVSSGGIIYVADSGNNSIRKIGLPDSSGVRQVTTVAGGDGGGDEQSDHSGNNGDDNGGATFNAPAGITFDDAGNLLVSDTGGNRIRLVNLQVSPVKVTTVAGTGKSGYLDGAASAARFSGPAGLAWNGALYVADRKNSAIRVVYSLPTLADLVAHRGPLTGGNLVRIFGSGFVPGATSVKFGASAATNVTVVGATELLATVPVGSAGPVDVVITTAAGSATLSGKYVYTPPPTLTSILPVKGPLAGGTAVAVNGSNFIDGETTLTIGGASATIASVAANTILAATPANNAGPADIVVTTPGGSAKLAAFRYLAPPSITGFTPATSRIGTSVTLTGANFDTDLGATSVRLGTVTAMVTSITPTQITVTVPSGAVDGKFSVTTAGGTATSATNFIVAVLTKINVTPAIAAILEGKAQAFTATGVYSDGSTPDLTPTVAWSTSNATLATITAAGVATGVKAGTASVTATSGPISGTAQLTVQPLLTSIAITPATAAVKQGKTQAFTATGTYDDGSTKNLTAQAAWSSSDPTLATIDASGLATTLKPGSVTITAKVDGFTTTAQLTIQPVVTQIAVTPATLSVAHHATGQLTATATYSDNTTKDVTATAAWNSSLGAIATVNAGTVTGVSPGTATITATLEGVSGSASVTINATVQSLAVTPAAASLTTGRATQLHAIATYSDNTTKDVTATASWSSSAAAIAMVNAGTVTAVSPGNATIAATVGTLSSTAVVTVTNPAPTVTALALVPNTASLTVGSTLQLTAQATYSDNSTQDVTVSATWSSGTPSVATVAAGLVSATGQGSAVVTGSFGGVSASATVQVSVSQPLPPDPATIAPPIDQTVITTIFESTKFLYTGANPIQTGVAPGTIDLVRAAVVRGRVLAHGGQPLPGVSVTIAGHPEYGSTLSRTDGQYDLAVNGGGTLTVRFRRSGFIPADREVRPASNDFAIADSLVMTPYDAGVTSVDLSAAGVHVARGSVMTDDAGSRRATLLFPSGTTATMMMADGSSRPLSSMHVRATEFTVGPEGPSAMPAPLPLSSGYTYCVDLSADEATTVGATAVNFSAPVALYFENFLHLRPGTHIPVGAYDPAQARWVPADNGKIVTIVAIQAGTAYLDVTGDGIADGPDAMAALGITDEERATLATLYGVNQQLWRVPIAHFSLWDANDPYGPVPGSKGPKKPKPKTKGKPKDNCGKCPGSIISVENQSLGEEVPVAGTPFSLHYESTRLRTIGSNQVQIEVIGNDPPPTGTKVELEINAAGQHTTMQLAPQGNLTVNYTWNGNDAYGRQVQGSVPISFRTKYTYKAVYQVPDVPPELFHATTPLFDQLSGIPSFEADWPRLEYSFTSDWANTSLEKSTVGQWNPKGLALGGWTLSPQHVYDYQSGMLHMGNGSQRSLQGIGTIVTTAAGGNASGATENVSATKARISFPGAMSFGSDGSLYVATGVTIRRIDPAGYLSTVGGTGGSTPPDRIAAARDGSIYMSFIRDQRLSVLRGGTVSDISIVDPLTNSAVAPQGISTDPQGDVWVAVGTRVYKINGAGQVLDWIGNGETGTNGDEGPAHKAQLMNATNVAVAPDGVIFLTSPSADNVRFVTTDGIIHAVRSGSESSFGSGGPVSGAFGFAVDRDHNIYITGLPMFQFSLSGPFVWIIRPDGSVNRIAGKGQKRDESLFGGDGGPALQALMQPQDVQVAPDGALYVSDASSKDAFDPANNRIRRIAQPMPGLGRDELGLPSSDGSQLYIFSPDGRHLRTIDAITGDLRLRFGYDRNGLLITLVDAHGNVVMINRAPDSGLPTELVAAGGQRTTFTTDGDGYFTSITNPAGERYAFAYDNGRHGWMQSLTDPKHQTHSFAYDTAGLLERDFDPAGGSTTLSRDTDDDRSYTVTRTTGEGRRSTHQIMTSDDGSYAATVVDTAGNTSSTTVSADGSAAARSADGTATNSLMTPDPRFGMQAPVEAQAIVATPGARQLSTFTTRSVTMTAAPNPTLSTFTETRTVAGNDFTSSFDAASRTWTMRTPAGRTVTTVLDSNGEILSTTVSGLAPLQYSRDTRGRLVGIAQGTRSLNFGFDNANNLISFTDPLQRTLRFDYDSAGRVLQQTFQDGRVIGFGYDANGHLTSVTPPARPTHGFPFNAADLQASYVPPPVTPGGSILYSYNKDRQLTRLDRPDGRSLAFAYDAAGRPLTLTMGRGTIRYQWEDGTGRLTSAAAPDGGILSYNYDGSLLVRATWAGSVSGSVSWDYDKRFALAQETVNCATATNLACQPVVFSRDSDALLTGAGPMGIQHDPQTGSITGTQVGQVADQWSYDSSGELTAYAANVNGSPVFSEQYTRDALGRITTKTETIAGSTATFSYAYDTSGRLTDVTANGALAAHYTYDENSNRLGRQTADGNSSATVDAQDRLLTYADTRYGYNAAGELVTKTDGAGTTSYDYDEIGNLLGVSLPNGHRVDYVIDVGNHRIGKRVDGVLVQRFIYASALGPVAELDANGDVVARFIYAKHANVPDLIIRGGATYRVISDHLGSPRMIINSDTGEVVETLAYNELGTVLSDSNPGFQPFGFAGGLRDDDTGLIRFGARDYDPRTGRWTAKDPVGFAGRDSNLYSYCAADPVNGVDPSGTIYEATQYWADLAVNGNGAQWVAGVVMGTFAAMLPDSYGVGVDGTAIGPPGSSVGAGLNAGVSMQSFITAKCNTSEGSGVYRFHGPVVGNSTLGAEGQLNIAWSPNQGQGASTWGGPFNQFTAGAGPWSLTYFWSPDGNWKGLALGYGRSTANESVNGGQTTYTRLHGDKY